MMNYYIPNYQMMKPTTLKPIIDYQPRPCPWYNWWWTMSTMSVQPIGPLNPTRGGPMPSPKCPNPPSDSYIPSPLGSLSQQQNPSTYRIPQVGRADILADDVTLLSVRTTETGLYNVKEFGATGDGISDDTGEIQTAIEAAQTAGGGTVFFPTGKYKISSTLNITGSNVQLEGRGDSSIIFLDKSTDTVIKIGHSNDLNQTTHNKIKNLAIDRSKLPDMNSYGIWVERARYTDIDEVTVYKSGCGIAVGPKGETGILNQFTNITNSKLLLGMFPDSGIIFYSGADHKVSKVFVEPGNRGIVMSGRSNGILIDSSTVINGSSYNYGIVSEGNGFARYVTNCIIENALQQQIFIGPLSERFTLTSSWLGAGNLEGDTRIGIQIEPGARTITIANNRIGDQRKMGILSRGDNVIIEGNILEGNVNGNFDCDSLQVEGGKHVILTGNRISSSADRYGVGLYDHASQPLDYYIFTNNDTSESGDGYNITATGTHRIIANNLS